MPAGLKAGQISDTFPLMFGRLIPEEDLLNIAINTCLLTASESMNKAVGTMSPRRALSRR